MEEFKKIEDLVIEGKSDLFFTPTVKFSANSGECIISGESYPEEAASFYKKLSSWIEDYLNVNEGIKLDFRLSYFNTSSSRGILDMLFILKEKERKGKSIEINWYFSDPDDNEVLLEAEDFMDDTGLKFNMIQY